MLEPWRSHYLQSMGVDVYLPRRELPAAAPSPQWVWDESAYQATELSNTKGLSNTKEPVALSESINDIAAPQRRHIVSPALPTVKNATGTRQRNSDITPAKASAAPALQIKLLIALSESGVLIIDDLGAQSSQRNEAQRLWGNLLFALQKKPITLQLEQFEWPLTNLRNKQIELNETAARETLVGFLSKKIQSGNVQTVILLGENAQHWIQPTQFQHLAGEPSLRWINSLATQAVLSDPQRKRQLWLDLHPLAQQH